MADVIREKVMECLSNVGIEIEEGNDDLLSYLQDSLVFVSFVIELEEIFQVELDDTLFVDETFSNIDTVCDVIRGLLSA